MYFYFGALMYFRSGVDSLADGLIIGMEMVSISAFGLSGPLVDRFTMEAPVATQLECR